MTDPTVHPALASYAAHIVPGPLDTTVPAFLLHHSAPQTLEHVRAVAVQAGQLAEAFREVDPAQAAAAGWLHDVSAVVPVSARCGLARRLGLEVYPEEERVPMLLHQRLSAELARRCFGVTDNAVLDAIRCHTTLRSGATVLDKVVFLADKTAWDQPGAPPYLSSVREALTASLEAAVGVYLRYLWERRAELPAVHPWFEAACHEYGFT